MAILGAYITSEITDTVVCSGRGSMVAVSGARVVMMQSVGCSSVQKINPPSPPGPLGQQVQRCIFETLDMGYASLVACDGLDYTSLIMLKSFG